MHVKIYKYQLEITDTQTIEINKRCQPLTVQVQNGKICLWCEADLETEMTTKTIEIYGTGHYVRSDEFQRGYIGTVQQDEGRLVWHIYMRV